MWPLLIVPIHVFHDRHPGVAHRVVGVQIRPLVFHRLPKAFNKNVVTPSSLTVHTQLAAHVLDGRYKLDRRKLTALIRAHDFRSAITAKGFLKHIDRMACLQGDRYL